MTIRIEERSLELAMVKAAGRLGVTQSDLAYRVLSKTNGFFGLFGKKISIEAWDKNKSTKNFLARFDYADEIPSDLQEDLHQFLSDLYVKMFGKKVDISVKLEKSGRLIFNLRCDYLASQLKNNTKIAESLEHLLRKKPRHIRSELPFRVFVDANGTRLGKEKDLVDMAKDLSDKVYENQKPIILNYQTPYDRKIIHLALDNDKRVYTKSIGVGQNRKLMILPSKEANG